MYFLWFILLTLDLIAYPKTANMSYLFEKCFPCLIIYKSFRTEGNIWLTKSDKDALLFDRIEHYFLF